MPLPTACWLHSSWPAALQLQSPAQAGGCRPGLHCCGTWPGPVLSYVLPEPSQDLALHTNITQSTRRPWTGCSWPPRTQLTRQPAQHCAVRMRGRMWGWKLGLSLAVTHVQQPAMAVLEQPIASLPGCVLASLTSRTLASSSSCTFFSRPRATCMQPQHVLVLHDRCTRR